MLHSLNNPTLVTSRFYECRSAQAGLRDHSAKLNLICDIPVRRAVHQIRYPRWVQTLPPIRYPRSYESAMIELPGRWGRQLRD